ncbi:hypothetical protein CPB83DRAFT_757544 [Crepidotus variabilis]|uniref:G domain-containing protein n=1 Tax=Crepidotus variabilis TaxID=179855 RepID=A0A9P6JVN0_9AGAR|nr:hypothetical protein CPB83DRAFT_757544 [Crepidotus variabilis]
MGPTGSGKSSFISKATGFQGGVGHDLKSCTNKVTTIRFSLPELVNNDIVFVDTPGFDDTNLPDTKILEMISDWLNQSYGRGIRLNGLLYFHRISDNRMAGTPLKNLRLFEKICGEGFDNVIMTTTMWDEVEDEEGDQREKELADIYWKTLIKRGSQVRRFYHTQESAFQVIASILKDANDADNKRIQQELENLGNVLLLQKEVMVGGKELSDTEAGRTLFLQLQVLVEKHQKILERIRENLREPNLTPEELQDLMKDYQKVADDLKKATEEMQTIAAKKGVSIGRLQKLASTPRNFYHFLQRFK